MLRFEENISSDVRIVLTETNQHSLIHRFPKRYALLLKVQRWRKVTRGVLLTHVHTFLEKLANERTNERTNDTTLPQ